MTASRFTVWLRTLLFKAVVQEAMVGAAKIILFVRNFQSTVTPLEVLEWHQRGRILKEHNGSLHILQRRIWMVGTACLQQWQMEWKQFTTSKSETKFFPLT